MNEFPFFPFHPLDDSHEISVYPPNILPASDLTIVSVASLLSQQLWNASAVNPSLEAL